MGFVEEKFSYVATFEETKTDFNLNIPVMLLPLRKKLK